MTDEKRILAIDFGTKRIGLALSDPLLIFAYPFITLLNDDKLWSNLAKIINEKKIVKIILGYPAQDRGSQTSVVQLIKDFKSSLEQNFGLEIEMWHEDYTSTMAAEKVLESVNKKSKRKQKGLLDQNSAAIILQEYLDLRSRKQK